MSAEDVILALAGGNPGAMILLAQLMQRGGLMTLLHVDVVHLYEHHISEVYQDVCGCDFDRFFYHINMELPCQICGELIIPNHLAANMSKKEKRVHLLFRQNGRPSSYWALEDPPTTPEYEYPIKGLLLELEFSIDSS
jgi:hypothetical protein